MTNFLYFLKLMIFIYEYEDKVKRNTVGSRTTEFTLVDYPPAERRTTRMCGAMDD